MRKTKICLLIILVLLLLECYGCNNSKHNIIYAADHRLQWWLDDINWNQERYEIDGEPIKIAVIDTGVDLNHPDLLGKVINEFRVSSLPKENDCNDFEHGTSVAGIIAAYPLSEKGVIGVAPDSKLISIDISDTDGIASQNDLIEAINIAIDSHVRIINISLGVENDTPALHEVIKKAYEKGIVIIASAGNDIKDITLYPAKYDEVISVGSLKKNGDRLFDHHDKYTKVYLPGENIVTTFSSHDDESKKYSSFKGTSVSAPILTGAVSLILQQNPALTNKQIYEFFQSQYTDKFDVKNILAALNAVQ